MSDYPRWMSHPHEQPAILSDDYEVGQRPPVGYSARPGKPRMFPPVQVMDASQEAYYAAQGYRVGNSHKPAFVPRPVMPLAAPMAAPAAAPELDPALWPTWLHREGKDSVLARTPQEAAAIEARWDAEDGVGAPSPNAQPAPAAPRKARAGGANKGVGLARRWELIREAKAMGIPADRSWTAERIERAIKEAEGEKQAEDDGEGKTQDADGEGDAGDAEDARQAYAAE
jgi:hypothetical protein